jgi:hypothetical protein
MYFHLLLFIHEHIGNVMQNVNLDIISYEHVSDTVVAKFFLELMTER